ncbi:bifunctional glutamate N-acetyltransferase/amino-acid acetyltransferase ArgJ [Methylomagnum sp.]
MSSAEYELEFLPVPGIRLGTAGAAIKRQGRDDVLVIEAVEGATCAAVFTRNAFCAAPVVVAREHLGRAPRWLLVNSGNANAGTGARGLDDARATCRILAEQVGAAPEQVLPFSTGIIGEYLPVDKIAAALPIAFRALDEANWPKAARAIMTTDTRPKLVSRAVEIAGQTITVTGISKGAGMIQPNMATMLAFLATDAKVEAKALQDCLAESADLSFNCVTVDGDTSTNDACVLLASGASGLPELSRDSADFPLFAQAVRDVCAELAEAIVRDGEGATKFIRIVVEEARDADEARSVAKTVAHSPLVKTAFFASDPNWGRILAAVGRAGCVGLDIDRVSIWLGEVRIVESGGRAPDYTEEAGAAVMAQKDITVRVALGRGDAVQTVLTCDFSYDYVRINAEYRT